jgi:hypothetical protein
MTIYYIADQFPIPMHPEDARVVKQDNTGQKYFFDRAEDQDGVEHDVKYYCYDSAQEAWQASLDRQECFINQVKERYQWLLSKAIANGYVPKETK